MKVPMDTRLTVLLKVSKDDIDSKILPCFNSGK